MLEIPRITKFSKFPKKLKITYRIKNSKKNETVEKKTERIPTRQKYVENFTKNVKSSKKMK